MTDSPAPKPAKKKKPVKAVKAMSPPPDGCVWVVGASSGIGAAVAEKMARDGWTVVASARRENLLQDMADAHKKSLGKIIPLTLDATDLKAVHAATQTVQDKHGPIHRFIYCTGTYVPESVEDFSAAAFRDIVEVNLMGAVHCLEAVMPQMLQRKGGHIVLVSSVAGYRGLPTSLSYSSTKAALIALAESLKIDLDPHNVKMQVVCPGFVKTPLTDKNTFRMPFLMDVDEAARCFAEAMDRDEFEITFPKQFTTLVKLGSLLPYPLYFNSVKDLKKR